MPGPSPADSRLYCTRTGAGTWIGFRWYRFVDQPELNQVFASLPEGQRDAAKCYMQARIERLHEAQQADPTSVPRWFDAPQGAKALPGPKVSIDRALLLVPPAGLEKGFVPIPVMERKRQKPEGCDVVLGQVTDEPNPIPEGYYEGFELPAGGYDVEICPSNTESNGAFSYPGTIYPYAPGPDQNKRVGYAVPTRDNVASVLSKTPVICGLSSDPL
jgi:hypothetical protein